MASTGSTKSKPWMKPLLTTAGLFNLIWALYLVLAPLDLFQRAGVPSPNLPLLVQMLGLGAGVLGLGFLMAANDPLRHWPVVLMGFTAKLGAALGYGLAALARPTAGRIALAGAAN